jgi:hypothetical protein
MKFCRRKLYTYKGVNNTDASTNYVSIEDVKEFHGKQFADKWLEFIKSKPSFDVDGLKCYYYIDYSFAARQTNSFLYPTG